MPFDVAWAAVLLAAPLVRHLRKGPVTQSVEFVGVHRVDATIEAAELRFQSPDCLIMLAALLGMAWMKSVSHPFRTSSSKWSRLRTAVSWSAPAQSN